MLPAQPGSFEMPSRIVEFLGHFQPALWSHGPKQLILGMTSLLHVGWLRGDHTTDNIAGRKAPSKDQRHRMDANKKSAWACAASRMFPSSSKPEASFKFVSL
jgi:hypothetical protein